MYAYDDQGYPHDIRFTGPANWHTAFKFDDRGNVIEETLLGADGKAAAGSEVGLSGVKPGNFRLTALAKKKRGSMRKARPLIPKAASIVVSASLMRRGIFTFLSPRTTILRASAISVTFANRNMMRRESYGGQTIRYEDKNGQPTINTAVSCTALEVTMDENERDVLEWKLGCDVKAWGAPVLRTDTEWQRSGARKRIVRAGM